MRYARFQDPRLAGPPIQGVGDAPEREELREWYKDICRNLRKAEKGDNLRRIKDLEILKKSVKRRIARTPKAKAY